VLVEAVRDASGQRALGPDLTGDAVEGTDLQLERVSPGVQQVTAVVGDRASRKANRLDRCQLRDDSDGRGHWHDQHQRPADR
jgi:hypothetical protein